MKIPEDQKYWDLCASICLINTIVEYLYIDDAGQISNLMQIEQALKDSQKFNLKEDSIKQLWDQAKMKKIWFETGSTLFWMIVIYEICFFIKNKIKLRFLW
ncbi:unnamed protein product [Blepharisma stoltei]|uniref:Uncharacterized protein n=1 Tax=Blepharisma stoltei TaxID=1481888 RepID=A0AAU9IHA7_9CILI|nr:unnamed protein product [Blepharisma stoltei]